MMDDEPGKWYVELRDGSEPPQRIPFNSPPGVTGCPVGLDVDLSTPHRFVSSAITIMGDPDQPRMIRVNSSEQHGSIILSLFSTHNRLINQWVIEGKNIEFVMVPPASREIVFTFRMIGPVKFLTPSIEIEEIPSQKAVDWILPRFDDPSLRRRKGYLEHYVDFLLKSKCNLRRLGFLEYLFSLDMNREIIEIIGDMSEDREIWRMRNRAKVRETVERPDTIIARLKALGIHGYRVPLINSGMGDILTTGNFCSYLCERFGLNYSGTFRTYEGVSKRGYYEVSFLDMGGKPLKNDRTLFITIDDIADDIDSLIDTIGRAEEGRYDDLCLIPSTPGSFARELKHSKLVCREFIKNQFNRYVKARSAIRTFDFPEKTVLIHARLGDVAPIVVGKWCINLYDFQKGNDFEGLVDLDSGNKSQTMRCHKNFLSLDDFLKFLKGIDSSIRLVFISDGLDLTRKMLTNKEMQNLIVDRLPGITAQDLITSLENMEERIHSLPVDQSQVGERTIDDFYNSIALIMSSDIIISTARSFVFNCLANFKYGDKTQHFFSPLVGGYFEVLNEKGCIIHQFTEFDRVKEEVANCLKSDIIAERWIVDITDQCVIDDILHSIDRSIDEAGIDGDGAMLNVSPTVKMIREGSVIDMKESHELFRIDLQFDDHEFDSSAPYIVEVSEGGIVWRRIFMCDFSRDNCSIDATGVVARYIRIIGLGHRPIGLMKQRIIIKKDDAAELSSDQWVSDKNGAI